jgi:16S rRNA (cytidine1402-2'-O)-methyltransferase
MAEHDAEPRSGAERGYMIRGRFFPAPALAPGLYVVATPIGNLSDITLRALDTIAGADILACEDTRVTRKLLSRYGISAKVTAYHEHSGLAAHRRVLAALDEGRAVALVSDAGTPLVSDPGLALVADAAAAGHPVVPIPGASSVFAALSAAGLPVESVLFLGFMPAKAGARRKRLAEVADVAATLVLFESPNRIAGLLEDALGTLGDRDAALCRELTKLHETFDRARLSELAGRYAGAGVKGEIVLLVEPPGPAAAPAEADIEEALRQALATANVKEAAQSVAAATGLPRRELYRRALALKEGR